MAKISALGELAEAPASTDEFVIVDKSDTTQSASGTTKRIQSQYVTIADASTTVKGKVELATDAETITGTDAVRAVTPANITAKIDTDGTLAGNLDTRIPSQKAVKTYTDTSIASIGDWKALGATLTYSSADSPTFVATTSVDLTSSISVGKKINLTQTQALTSYWSFDSNSNDGVGTNNGTDTAMSYTAGKFSNAATFNGTTSKIVITDAASLKPTGEFTIGMWVKSSSAGTIGLFQTYSANTNIAGIITYLSSSKMVLSVGNNTGTTLGTNYSTFTTNTTIADGSFHYIVISFRNNFMQIYVDGVLDISGYCLAPAYAATNYVRVGCLNATGTDNSFGVVYIDDLFLINGYALDENTIKTKYIAQTAQGTSSITLSKNFFVTAINTTTITLYGGTDYTLANSSITLPYSSSMKAPFGFPINPKKWASEITSTSLLSQATPTNNIWYNVGALSLIIPIGVWNVSYKVSARADATSGQLQISTALSTTNNAANNDDFTAHMLAGNTVYAECAFFVQSTLSLTSKTTYYLNEMSNGTSVSNIYLMGTVGKIIIRAVCAYL